MLSAFLLGLFGSVGHCTGMCSGVALLLGRTTGARGWRVVLLHLGRVTTYSAMGLAAGALGYALAGMCGGQVGATPTGFMIIQGGLAFLAAAAAIYMAVAFMGRAPSPELLLSRVTGWWGRTMRRITASRPAPPSSNQGGNSFIAGLRSLVSTYALGLLWGMLPCGLVLMALLLAAVSGSAQRGALTMALFGLGTWPLVLGVTLAPRTQLLQRKAAPWVRPATAAIIMLFGVQMALRGLAAWGIVEHTHLGKVMLW